MMEGVLTERDRENNRRRIDLKLGKIALFAFIAVTFGRTIAFSEMNPWTVVPLPAFFYLPETSFGGGAAVLASFSPPNAKSHSYQIGAIYTAKNQLAIFSGFESYLSNDDLRLSGVVTYARFPTKYFGIGPQASLEEEYTPVAIRAEASVGWQVLPHFYAGPAYRFTATRLVAVEPQGELASRLIPGSGQTVSSGAGILLLWDEKESPVYPRSGFLFSLDAIAFPTALGSSDDWWRVKLDSRVYIGIAGDHVVALQAIAAMTGGAVPFQEMPAIGGPSLLRGYYEGRYRDRALLAAQAEYRFPLCWRLGGVLFGGVAQVGPSYVQMSFDRLKAAGGIGLRFRVLEPERINFRADMGFSPEGTEFYVSIGEAY